MELGGFRHENWFCGPIIMSISCTLHFDLTVYKTYTLVLFALLGFFFFEALMDFFEGVGDGLGIAL